MQTNEDGKYFDDELKKLGRFDLIKKRVGTVDQPPVHYDGGPSVYDFISGHQMSFAQGNVIKYITRYKKKGQPLEDLNKARAYIDLMLKELED